MNKTDDFLERELDRSISERGPAGGGRAEAALGEPDHRFQALFNALPAAVYTTDASGRLTYSNEAAAELWGYRPTPGSADWRDPWKLFWPDGTPMSPEERPMAVALRERRPVRDMEVICERPDGTRVHLIPYPTPLYDEAGRMVGAVNMLVDITERRRAEDRQQLMVRELHHRVKNTLATVQAIMGSTARSAKTIEEFQDALIGRIAALAKTHVLLADDVTSVSFDSILHSELDAFDDGSEGRITLHGPPVAISPQTAVPLGLAIHELTTNAAKYGSLSVYGGKVDVTWTETIEMRRRRLDFDWVESGGPALTPPTRRGFGTRLLQFVLPGQIQAKVSIEYRPDGVRVHGTVPLPMTKAE